MTKTNKLLLAAAPAVLMACAIAGPAAAQSGPAVLTVDVDRAAASCTACITASNAFQAQVQAAQTRQQALQAQVQAAGQPLQTAVNALNGARPDAALQARITAFQAQQQSAATEVQTTDQRLQSTQQNISQQIVGRISTVSEAIRQTRGAALVVSRGSALAAAANTDVTNDVVAQLNAQTTPISVTPLAQQGGAATTPGTTAPAATTPRPRSSGR